MHIRRAASYEHQWRSTGPLQVLGHVRVTFNFLHSATNPPCRSLVASHGYLLRARNLFQHHQRGIASAVRCLEHLGVYDQSVAVLHQQISVVTQLRFFCLAFACLFASGSVFDACVWFDRFSPWKSTVALPGSSGGTVFFASLR